MNKIILSIGLIFSLSLSASEPESSDGFMERIGKEIGKCAGEIRRGAESQSSGSNLPGGPNAGTATAAIISATGVKVGGTLKAGGALLIKGVGMLNPYYVAGGAAVGIVSYGSYKLYQKRNPNPAKRAEDAENKAREAHAIEEANLSRCRQGLKDCLMKNDSAPLNNDGIPIPCEMARRNLGIQGGEEEVERITSPYRRFVLAQKR